LEFWPFVPDRLEAVERGEISFNSPVGILAVCAMSPGTGWIELLTVSIPRLEFWPFVLAPAPVASQGTSCFNSPVGILAVCAHSGGHLHLLAILSFNSPVGILAVCALIVSNETGRLF